MNLFKNFELIDKCLYANRINTIVLKLIKNKIYEDYFFKTVTSEVWFETLEKKGYFNPKNNPPPILDKKNGGYKIPEWNILQYLEKVSKQTRKYDKELLKIIKNVSLNKVHVDNYRTWWYFTKILLNIPYAKTPYNIFEKAMPIWLTSIFDLTLPGSDLANDLLPKYLGQIKNKDDIRKVEKLVEILLSVKEVKTKSSVLGKTLEVKTKIDNYWLEESFLKKDNAVIIAQKCTSAPIYNLANLIKEIFNKKFKKQDYSHIWLNNLSLEPKKSYYNDEYFLVAILRKLVIEKSKFDIIEGSKIIAKFLSKDYPHYIFKRLAILLIADSWDSSSEYFNQILDDKAEQYFEIDAFQPELIYLLQKNVEQLTNQQKIKITKIIEKGPVINLPDSREEEHKNYWKQRWSKVLESIPEFKKLYNQLENISKQKIVLNIDKQNGQLREVVFDKSPISSEQFLTKSNKEILKIITEYRPTGDFSNSAPEGLYRAFQDAIELDPLKFSSNLDPFKICNFHMLSSLYSGLEEAWKQKKDILWEKVIKFTIELLNEDWFWKSAKINKTQNYDYFGWTISAIGDLIQEGCKRDGWAFSEENNLGVEKIINIIVKKLSNETKEYRNDGISQALNTSWGKILTALIYLSLREARLSDKKNENKKSKWSKDLKNNFESALNKNISEANTLLGQYAPNLYYVDAKWTESILKKIHLKDKKTFEMFMEGYLFTGNIYQNIYELMKKSYVRALQIDFKEKRIQERLIQHITVGYLRGNEELNNNSLIDKILKIKNGKYTREIIEFLWHQRDSILENQSGSLQESKEFKKRIFVFWEYIINLYKKKGYKSEDDKKVLSELAKFAIYVEKLDKESFEKLLISAQYVTYDFDSPFFIEYLNKLKETGDKKESAKYVGILFLEMLKGAQDLIPDYKWDNVVEIINKLYEVGQNNVEIKNLANQICIFYAEHRDLHLKELREIYEKNNP